MNASEKNSFEEQWRSAFEDAELSPEPLVWANIEMQLADKEADKYKRRLFLFKMRAAAGIAILLVAVGIWGLNSYFGQQPLVATGGTPMPATTTQTSKAASEPLGVASTPDQTITKSTEGSDVLAEDTPPIATKVTKPAPKAAHSEKGVSEMQKTFHRETIATTTMRVDTTNTAHLRQRKKVRPVSADSQSETPVYVAMTPAHTKGGHISQIQETRMNPVTNTSQTEVQNELLAEKVVPEVKNTDGTNGISVVAETSVNTSETPQVVADVPTIVSGGIEITPLTPHSIQTQYHIPAPKDIRWKLYEDFWNRVEATETAQLKKKNKDSQQPRWQVGMGLATGLFNPNFIANHSSATLPTTFTGVFFDANQHVKSGFQSTPIVKTNEISRKGVAYATSVQAEYALSKRFSIQGGLQYNYNHSQVEVSPALVNIAESQLSTAFSNVLNNGVLLRSVDTFSAGPVFNGNGGYTPIKIDPQVVSNTYQYVRVPMQVLYKLLNRTIRASVGTGVSADIFLKNAIEQAGRQGEHLEITPANNSVYRNIGFSGLLSLKMDYTFAKRYSIFIEPSYRQALTSFTTSKQLESYPNWWGIGTGFQYRF